MARKTAAIVLGLMLGWLAAGAINSAPTFAAGDEDAEKVAAKADAHAAPDPGQLGAKALVPAKEDMTFYRPVVLTIIGLFVAAAVVGLFARSFGIQDPGIVAGEEDQADAHDDHGHGDHGHH